MSQGKTTLTDTFMDLAQRLHIWLDFWERGGNASYIQLADLFYDLTDLFVKLVKSGEDMEPALLELTNVATRLNKLMKTRECSTIEPLRHKAMMQVMGVARPNDI